MVHVHCFTRSSDPHQDIQQVKRFSPYFVIVLKTDLFLMKRVCQIMGGPIDKASCHLHWVRTVAPKKDMYCISFRLSPDIAFM